MSYILDALRKAESERKTGSVPHPGDRHHTFFPIAGAAVAPRIWPRAVIACALLLAVALLAFGWLKLGPSWAPGATAPTVAPVPSAPHAAAAPPAAPPPVTKAPAPVTPAPAALDAPPPARPARRAPEEARSASRHTRQEDALPKSRPRPAAPVAEKKPASTPPAPAAPETPERVSLASELPAHVRSQLPALQVSGYLYSSKKADRTVLINNKLVREGDQVAPDLTLETLTPNGMVLNYKGYRYRASY